MIKIFEDFDLARVGQFQSVLEAEGIQTHLKNQFMSSAMGEIPFVEVLPELWILEDGDLVKARRLIQELLPRSENNEPEWTCSECDSVVDGVFDRCWKCNAQRPDSNGDRKTP